MEEYYEKPEENGKTENNTNGSETPKTYGAAYTPSDEGNGEYHFTPYTRSNLNDGTAGTNPGAQRSADPNPNPAPAPQKPPKKKGHAGRIIGITAAVMACIITLAACSVGVMYAAKKLFPGGSGSNEGTAEETSGALSESTVDYSNTEVKIVDPEDTGSVTTRTVARGELMTVEEAVAAVKDSVVEITTETVTSIRGYGNYVQSGAGSGVIISEDGKIITNNHVIEDASKITVRLTDGTEFEATLIATDEDEDVAVISIVPGDKQLTAAVLGDSDALNAGQSVIVIGNPLGELGGSVSAGIISATKREVGVDDVGTMTLIQTDAAVNPGNSGGGMFNLYGELIGVVNSKYSDTDVEGLGFAIPINDAWAVAQDLMTVGYVKGKVTLGLKGISIADETVQYSFSYGTCVVVTAADDDSDFKVNDIITAINGTSVSSVSDVKKVLKTLSAGDKVSVKVTRQVNMGFYTSSRTGYLDAEVYEISQTGLE